MAVYDEGQSLRLYNRALVRNLALPEGLLEQPDVCLVTYTDISERFQMEERLRDNYELMLAAIDSAEEAFVMYDENDRMVYSNGKYKQLYAELLKWVSHGDTFEDVVRIGAENGFFRDAVGRLDEFVAERVAAHRSGNDTVLTRMADGRVVRVMDRKLANGYTVGFRFDVTELVRATEQAHALAQVKGQFLANMSHEIRTPLNAVMGMLKLLQGSELTERQRDHVSKATGAAKGLLGLLNDVLDFSKVDAGKMQLEQVPFELDTVLRNLSVVLSANVGHKKIDVLFDVDADLPPRVLGDALRLQQVLVNMGGNAVKFTEQGQVVIAIRKLASTGNAQGDTVRLTFSVQDTGIGIAPEHFATIFEGFSQAEVSTTRRFGGSGLGLSISKQLLSLMGGEIQIESSLGEGSTFSFALTLPIAGALPAERTDGDPSSAGAQTALVVDDNPATGPMLADALSDASKARKSIRRHSVGRSTAGQLAGMRILVVEDNLINQQIADELLSAEGALVALAANGQLGVDAVRLAAPQFDVVLMDVQMPVLDGYAATWAIRNELGFERLPIIAMSANAMAGDPEICRMAGMNEHIAKPFDMAKLVSLLRRTTGFVG